MSIRHSPRVIALWLGVCAALCILFGTLLQFTGILTALSAPQVLAFAPRGTDIAPTSPITVTFLTAMNPRATENAFQISPHVAGKFHWIDDRTVVFSPLTSFPLSSTVTLNISREARSWLSRPPDQDFTASITTAGPPRVTDSVPALEAQFVYLPDRLELTFNREMDRASVESHLRIAPPVANLHLEWDKTRLVIRGALEPLTHYRITLERGARDDRYGLATQQEFGWSFSTTEQYPFFSFVKAGYYGMVAADHPASIRVQFVNCTRLDARLYKIDLDALLRTFGLAPEQWLDFSPGGEPFKSWSQNAAIAPDQFTTRELALGVLPAGAYYLTVTTPEGISDSRVLIASKTALTLKRAGDSVLIWATNLDDGTPVPDLALDFYDAQGKKAGEGKTDAQGLYVGQLQAAGLRVVGSRSNDFAVVSVDWQDGVEPWHWLENPSPALSVSDPTTTVSETVQKEAFIVASPSSYVAMKGEPVHFGIRAFDAQGQSQGGVRLEYTLIHIAWDCATHTDEQGRHLYRCDSMANQVLSGSLAADRSGAARLAFTPPHGGEYRLDLQWRDAHGNLVRGQTKVCVSAPDEFVNWRFEESPQLLLTLGQQVYAPGDTIQLLIQSPYEQGTALVTVERERILAHQVVHLDSNSAVIELPVAKEFGTGVYISVVLVPGKGQGASFKIGYAGVKSAAGGLEFDMDSPAVKVAQTLTVLAAR